VLLIAADESAHRVDAEQNGGVEQLQQKLLFRPASARDRGAERLSKYANVRNADARRFDGAFHAASRVPVEWLDGSSVFATGSSIASAGTSASLGWNALDTCTTSAPSSRERQPFLDREIRIGVASAAWA
jgi:hypothetical protein